MFNNAAIDVAIGLIFIFLLYSLLASILLEIIAKMFSLRARNLVRALRRMLEDSTAEADYHRGTLLTWFLEFGRDFLYYFQPVKSASALDQFYRAPTIRYLGENSARSKPARIYPNTFSQTIVHLLRGNGFDARTQNESQEIQNALQHNALNLGPDTLRQVRNLFEDARHDVVQFRILLEKWYDETMERATGWYIRQSQILLLWIGLLLSAAFNVDSIAIAKILMKDKKAREQLVQMAISRQEEYGRVVSSLNQGTAPVPDSVRTFQLEKAQADLDSARADYQRLAADAREVQNLLGLGKTPDGTQPYKYLGWILTALAVSLGAAFWFDLLCKLTAIRGVVRKSAPSPTRTNTTTQPPVVG